MSCTTLRRDISYLPLSRDWHHKPRPSCRYSLTISYPSATTKVRRRIEISGRNVGEIVLPHCRCRAKRNLPSVAKNQTLCLWSTIAESSHYADENLLILTFSVKDCLKLRHFGHSLTNRAQTYPRSTRIK